jgi:hypothetical protein
MLFLFVGFDLFVGLIPLFDIVAIPFHLLPVALRTGIAKEDAIAVILRFARTLDHAIAFDHVNLLLDKPACGLEAKRPLASCYLRRFGCADRRSSFLDRGNDIAVAVIDRDALLFVSLVVHVDLPSSL